MANSSNDTHELKPFRQGSNVENFQRYNRSQWRSEEELQYNSYPPDYGTMYDSDDELNQGFFKKYRRNIIMVGISTLLVFFYTSYVLLVPMCVTGETLNGSDAYSVVLVVAIASTVGLTLVVICMRLSRATYVTWKHDQMPWVVAAGLCNMMAFLFVLYSGLPARTPAHLQVILFTLCVPAAMGSRYLLLKQNIEKSQLVCVVAVLVGVFVSLIPRLIPKKYIPDSNEEGVQNMTNTLYEDMSDEMTWLSRVLWPLAFGFAYCITGLFMVITEKLVKVESPNPVVLALYCKFVTLCGAAILFWTDVIPGIGMSSDLRHMGQHLKHTVDCLFGVDMDTCGNVTWRLWALNFCGPAGLLTGILVTCYGEGAIFTTLLVALTLPLGTIFWTLFTDTGTSIIWNPKLTVESVFAFIGLLIILPPMVLYDYFGRRMDVAMSGFTRFH